MAAEEAEEVEGLLDHTEDPDDGAADAADDDDGEDEVRACACACVAAVEGSAVGGFEVGVAACFAWRSHPEATHSLLLSSV
jgi:hypothetical protein